MTEPFPFGGVEDDAPAAYDEPTRDNRKTIALGAVAALVLGAGAFFFLGGGGDETEEAFTAPVRSPRVAAAKAPATKPVVKLPVASQVQLGRNPFRALYVEPAEPVADGGASVVDPAAPAGPTGTPVVVTAGGTTSQPPTSGAPPKPVLHKVVLMRVYGEGNDRTAVFSIDGRQQIAKVGAVFGPTAELLLLSVQQGPADAQWTAVLQVGDGDPFDIVTGESKYVP
ncbi:MAG: hypothetical protein JWP11_1125 [Frankiales bacterium]|nr:hypothetical protein [Frankiales bacterium]